MVTMNRSGEAIVWIKQEQSRVISSFKSRHGDGFRLKKIGLPGLCVAPGQDSESFRPGQPSFLLFFSPHFHLSINP